MPNSAPATNIVTPGIEIRRHADPDRACAAHIAAAPAIAGGWIA